MEKLWTWNLETRIQIPRIIKWKAQQLHSRAEEAQKKIDNLSTDIVSLQSILTDKKSRGIYGEINLKHILVNVFGEKNDKNLVIIIHYQ